LVKLNNTGELIWSKILDVAPSIKCNSMIQTLDGGFALTGEISLDMLIVKLNAVCELEWIKTIPSADRGYSIIQTFDGGYVIGGNAFTDMCIIKFDGSGITCPLTNSHSGSISSGGTLDSGGVSGSGGIVGNGEIFDIGGSLIVVCTSN
jgi:hypothetical protein